MKFSFCLIGLIFLLSISLNAQILRGTVLAKQTKIPIVAASVFLSNTSIGTTTNDKGEFTINNFPTGKYDVVIASIGYTTEIVTISSSAINELQMIYLTPKAKELDEVIVRQYEKDGWTKWGSFFLEQCIGKSYAAKNCILKNKEVVKFKFNKKQNILEAFADEALIIENPILGYTLIYELKAFEFNFTTRIFYYQGFPLFTDKETKKRRQKAKWLANRDDAYYGSLMHFMRSFYRNKLQEDGFEIRKLIVKPNLEKLRVKEKYRSMVSIGNISLSRPNVNADSSEYFNNILSQPNEINYLVKTILPVDSFAYALDSATAFLEFNDHLHVTYTKKREPFEYAEYRQKTTGNSFENRISTIQPLQGLVSTVYLTKNEGVAVVANGNYYPGANIICTQYWAWSEKLGNLLPLNYKVNKVLNN